LIKQVSVELMPAFAAEPGLQAYYGYRSISAADASAQQQIRGPQLLLSIDGTDRYTDIRRTDTRPLHIDPAPHTMRARSTTQLILLVFAHMIKQHDAQRSNVLHCCQRRTERRPHVYTSLRSVRSGNTVSEIRERTDVHIIC